MRHLIIPAAIIAMVSGCGEQASQPHAFNVYFESNKASLTADARAIVDQAATTVQSEQPYRIVVQGAATGDTARDASLAAERADAVAQALIAAHVDPSKIDRQAIVVEPSAEIIADRVAARKVQIELMPTAEYARQHALQAARSTPAHGSPTVTQQAER